MTWQSGKKLEKGKYTIMQVLGSGRLSVTYLAETSDGQRVVIKAPNDEAVQQSDFNRLQQVFVQEAFKLFRCQHPNIVKSDEPFQEDGIWCIPMEYIAGTTLDQRDRQVLPEAEAIKYMQQIGSALVTVHAEKLFHRDVTPKNIMLRIRNGQSEAVLIDFGLSRNFDYILSCSRPDEISPGFTPPELYSRNQQLGAFSDIYSLGATLYNLLTGKTPPNAEERQTAGIDLEFPSEISSRIKQAIRWAMALKPKDRPQSVQEWLEELGQGSKINAPLSNNISSSKPLEFRVNWTVIWAGVAAVGTLLTGLAVIPDLIKNFNSNSPTISHPTQTRTP